MPVIESKIMINSKSFKKNQQDHEKLIDEAANEISSFVENASLEDLSK